MKAILVLGTLVDLALAALLIGISGFIFGSGPEGMDGALWSAVAWSVALAACLGMPIAGMVLFRRGHPGFGAFIGWLPAIIGAVLAFAPINPY